MEDYIGHFTPSGAKVGPADASAQLGVADHREEGSHELQGLLTCTLITNADLRSEQQMYLGNENFRKASHIWNQMVTAFFRGSRVE